MLLDCDVVPARDPAYLFDSREFVEAGNLFWGDIYNEGLVKYDESADYVGAPPPPPRARLAAPAAAGPRGRAGCD